MSDIGRNRAIVTGASGGIGMAIVERLARDGLDICGCMRSEKPEVLERWAAWSKDYGVSIEPVYFDLADEDGIKTAMEPILKDKDHPISVLVNNAGVPYGATAMMTPMKDLHEVMQVNFFGSIFLSQLVAKRMMRRKAGAIVNVASVGGIETNPGYLAYGSSKAALIYATRVMAKELGATGVRVNAVAPGLTETPMGHFKSEDELEKVLARTPMGRMAKPEEIASMVAYLVSDEAAYVTGQVIAVDGGRSSG